jgi:hypothetical protein
MGRIADTTPVSLSYVVPKKGGFGTGWGFRTNGRQSVFSKDYTVKD